MLFKAVGKMHKCARVMAYLLFSGYRNNEVGRVYTVPGNIFHALFKEWSLGIFLSAVDK